MENTKMVVETKLNFLEYISVTDAIVDGYFDIDNEYQPHVGLANTMRLFYNACVKESPFDSELPHDFSDIMLVDKLAADIDFIRAFNDALFPGTYFAFTFANAYNTAMDIVHNKRHSITSAIVEIKNAILSVMDSVKGTVTQENLDTVARIAQDIADGKIDFAQMMNAFADSPEFEKVVTSGIKDDERTEPQANNVVPIKATKDE